MLTSNMLFSPCKTQQRYYKYKLIVCALSWDMIFLSKFQNSLTMCLFLAKICSFLFVLRFCSFHLTEQKHCFRNRMHPCTLLWVRPHCINLLNCSWFQFNTVAVGGCKAELQWGRILQRGNAARLTDWQKMDFLHQKLKQIKFAKQNTVLPCPAFL